MSIEVRERIVPIQKTRTERIAALQKQLAMEVADFETGIVADLQRVLDALGEASGLPLSPGKKEELRQLAEAMASSIQRLEALMGRQ